MAEDSWYFTRGSRVVGPFGFNQLRAMVADGRLRRDDWVARAGDSDWCPVAGVPRLLTPGFMTVDADMLPVTPLGRMLGRWAYAGFGFIALAFWGSCFGLWAWQSRVPPPPPPLPVNVTYRPAGGGDVTVVVVNTGTASLTGVRVVVAGGHGVVASGDGVVAGRAEHTIRELSVAGEVNVGAAELGGWVVRPGESIWVIKDGFSPANGVVPLVGTAVEQAALARPHITCGIHNSARGANAGKVAVIENRLKLPVFQVRVRVTAANGSTVGEFVKARLEAGGCMDVGRVQVSRNLVSGDRVQVWLWEAELLTYTVP